jgi:hypothetical protein
MSDHTTALLHQLRRPMPTWARPLFLACLAVGAVTFALLLLTADANRAWRIYHVNWLFWTGLAQAMVLFAAVTTVAKGRFAVPLRRLGEAAVAFLPASLLLFAGLWFGRQELFVWVRHPITDIPSKAFWLRAPFMFARDGAALLVLFGTSVAFVAHGLRLDAALVGDAAPAGARAWYARLTAGWKGADWSFERREFLAPLLIVLYAVCFSLIAFDLVMSLAPTWDSNLLGGFFFMGAWLAGLMTLALFLLFFRRHYGLDELWPLKLQHDLAKLCFGFTVFWAYLFFSQFLVIWYGNMPHETKFIFLRMTRPEWRGISIAMIVMCFLIPFVGLIGIKPKKTPATLATFAVISLCGLWVDRFVLVVPSVMQTSAGLPLGWQEVGITAGFLGIFGLCYLWFAERFPLVSPALVAHEMERRRHPHTSG